MFLYWCKADGDSSVPIRYAKTILTSVRKIIIAYPAFIDFC